MSDEVEKKTVFEVRYSQRGKPGLKIIEAVDEDDAKNQVRKELGTGVKFISVTAY